MIGLMSANRYFSIKEVDPPWSNQYYFWGSWFYFRTQQYFPLQKPPKYTPCIVYRVPLIFFIGFLAHDWWVSLKLRVNFSFCSGAAHWFPGSSYALPCNSISFSESISFSDGFSSVKTSWIIVRELGTSF